MRPSRFPLWVLLLSGYAAFSRDFSYIGVPPLYIGEAYLGYAFLRNQRNWISRFIHDCLRLQALPLAIAGHLMWGGIEVTRSVYMGRSLMDAVRTAAFNYYPLYILVGIAIGATVSYPYLIRVVKFVTIVVDIRVLIWLILPALALAPPGNVAFVPVLMVAAWKDLKRWMLLIPSLLLNLYPSLFMTTHGRGTMLGLFAGLAAVMASSRKMMLQSCIIGGSVMMLLLLLGPYIPGPAGSGPPLDPVVLVARVIAADHPDFAINMIKWRSGGRASGGYRDELDNLYGARDTAGWRKAIWTNAIASLRTPGLKLMGMGEAVSLAGLTPDGTDIHTPHNISIYCIYYTGYIGLVVFLFLLYAMWLVGSQLKDDRLRTIYMASFWCTLLVAITGNCLEAPFGAIPIYLFLGVVIGLDRKIAAENKILRRLRAEQAYDDAAEAQAERGGDQIPAFSQYEVMR